MSTRSTRMHSGSVTPASTRNSVETVIVEPASIRCDSFASGDLKESYDVSHVHSLRESRNYSHKNKLIKDRRIFQLTTTHSQDRGHWHSDHDFVMAGICYCVGLGNLWRFPGVVYANGGAAFLIPYTILHLLVALPVVLLEATVGQYSGKGPIQMWSINYAATGFAITRVIANIVVSIQYNRITAWVLFYMFASMQSPLPWVQCEPKWIQKKCYHPDSAVSFPLCYKPNVTDRNSTHVGCKCSGIITDDFNTSHDCFSQELSYENLTKYAAFKNCTKLLFCTNDTQSPSLFYFEKNILLINDNDNITYDIENIGAPSWYLTYCNLLSWIVVVCCLAKGISTMSRVLYFTVIFPYIILLCLLLNVVGKPGASTGIEKFIVPEWGKILDSRVWAEAVFQMTYSFAFFSGGVMTASSYNRYHHNVYRDTFIMVGCDYMTSFFAGLVIYANIGVLNDQTERTAAYDEVVENLTFVVLADAITRMQWSTFWAVNFFFMMFTMGIDSLFFLVEISLTAVKDFFPVMRKHTLPLAIAYSTICFFLGLPLLTPGARFVEDVTLAFFAYIANLYVLFVSVLLAWVYGGNRMMNHLTDILGFEPWPRWYWILNWMISMPAMSIFLFVNELSRSDYKYHDNTDMGAPAIFFAWFVFLLVLSPGPGWFIYTVYKTEGKTCCEKLVRATQPTADWMPRLESRTSLFAMSEMAVKSNTVASRRVSHVTHDRQSDSDVTDFQIIRKTHVRPKV